MNRSVLLIILLCLYSSTEAQVRWADQTWGSQLIFMSADSLGNTYITGDGSGVASCQGVSLTSPLIFAKFNTNGKLLWGKGTIGPAEEMYAIANDKAGNCYAAGTYDNEFTTDLFGIDSFTTPYDPFSNIFLCKFDTLGRVLWLKGVGGSGSNFVGDMTVDDSANVYLLGSFEQTFQLEGNDIQSNGPGGDWGNMFLAKYNSEGQLLWIDTTICQQISRIKIDRRGDIVFAGNFQGGLSCHDTAFIASGFNIFIEKERPNGSRRWICHISDTLGADKRLLDYKIDRDNNLYFLATLPADVTIGDTLIHLPSSGNYVFKLDENAHFKWINKISSQGSVLHDAEHIYVSFRDSVHAISSTYTVDTFMHGETGIDDDGNPTYVLVTDFYRHDSDYVDYTFSSESGGILSSRRLVGIPHSLIEATVINDAHDNLYCYSAFFTSCIVDTTTFQTSFYSTFLLKYGASYTVSNNDDPPIDTLLPPTPLPSHFELVPNPVGNTLNIIPPDSGYFSVTVIDISGRTAQSYGYYKGITSIPVENLSQGMYVLHIRDDAGIAANIKMIKK